MRKAIFGLLALVALVQPALSEVWTARYGVAETFNFKLYNTDGTLDVDEADGGTEVSLSCNEGAETTATNDFVDEGTFYSIALTAAEMQCERVAVVVAATTTEVFFIQTVANASAMTPLVEANVASHTDGSIVAADFATDAITATVIAADAIGASELATDAIGAAEIAANALTTAEIATGAISSDEVADDAIDAGAIAASAIGASELATDAIGATEVAAGAIAADAFAAGAIDATAIATDAIGAAEVAADAIASSELAATATQEVVDATWEEAIGDHSATVGSTAEALAAAGGGGATDQELGILRQGTAQSATATTLVLDSGAAFADDVPIGMTLVACGSTQGYCQSRAVTDYVLSTDTATVATWTVTPSGTITFYLFGTAPGAAGSGATAQEVWEYATRSLTILDEDSTTIDLNATPVVTGSITDGAIAAADFAAGAIDAAAIAADAIGASEIAAAAIGASEIATDAIGAAEVAADAGTELGTAAWATTTRVLTALDEDTTTIDLNASAVGSVAGAVGSVTGAVGSIATGGIAAASFAAGAIDATAIAAAAIGASEIATDAIGAAEIATDAIGTDETAILDVNVEQMNGVTVLGAGTEADPWNGE